MTDNHLLLYRLVELMFEHEQQILPVDLLFNDEQIGDFVKSIQIDSPYQQMLLEGVLTESVRDEKLYVSVTVEGYFHYVLGEVLYVKTRDHESGVLKQIIEQNRLNGIKEGIEQCLIRDIVNQYYERVIRLIDMGGKISECCSVPFAFGIQSAYNNQIDNNKTGNVNSIDYLVELLISNPSESDYHVLYASILRLEMAQKNDCLLTLFHSIYNIKHYNSIYYIKIIVTGLSFFEQELKFSLLLELENSLEGFLNHEDYTEILFELATTWVKCSEYQRAISLFEKTLALLSNRMESNQEIIEKVYCNLGAAYWYQGDLKMTQYYFELSYSKCLEIYGLHHETTAGSILNLGLVNVMRNEYSESIELFNQALTISLETEGLTHPNTARILSNIGSAHFMMKNYDLATNLFNRVLEIDKSVLHSLHPSLALDYGDLADVFSEKGDKINALENYQLSQSIFVHNYGWDFPQVKSLQEKIDNLNDL